MKRLTQFLTGVVALSVGATGAQAQVIDFQLDTYGCFFEAGDPACDPLATNDTWGALSFEGVTAEMASSTGFPQPNNTAGFNLGTFTLSPVNQTFDGGFVLRTVFILPSTTGGDTDVREATVTGAVSSSGAGAVTITFPSLLERFFFTQGSWSGFFDYSVATNTVVEADVEETLGGSANVAVTPEPISMILVGSGLLGLGGVARRRRNGEVAA